MPARISSAERGSMSLNSSSEASPCSFRRSICSSRSASSSSRSAGQLLLEVVGVGLAGLGVDVGDDVAGEVQDLLEVLALDVEQAREREARGALEVPDVAHGGRELDVAHTLAAHLGRGHLNATALADDAAEADALVLAAGALPVLGGAEDLLAEQAVLLGLEGAVVDGLGLLDLALRPAADAVGRGEGDLDGVEVGGVEVCHCRYSLSLFTSPARTASALSRSSFRADEVIGGGPCRRRRPRRSRQRPPPAPGRRDRRASCRRSARCPGPGSESP